KPASISRSQGWGAISVMRCGLSVRQVRTTVREDAWQSRYGLRGLEMRSAWLAMHERAGAGSESKTKDAGSPLRGDDGPASRRDGRGPLRHLTRLTYSPLRVSTLMISSWPTNSGTRTTAPVSRVAGLPPPPEVSPRTPGSVWVILSSTKLGGVTAIG